MCVRLCVWREHNRGVLCYGRGNESRGATHRTSGRRGPRHPRVPPWGPRPSPGAGGVGCPVARKSMLPRGTAFSVCACACAHVCGRVRGVRVSLQSRKHWCIPFVLSMLNKPGFVMDNTFFFFFLKRNIEELQKSLRYKKSVRVSVCIYIFIYL